MPRRDYRMTYYRINLIKIKYKLKRVVSKFPRNSEENAFVFLIGNINKFHANFHMEKDNIFLQFLDYSSQIDTDWDSHVTHIQSKYILIEEVPNCINLPSLSMGSYRNQK